MRFRAQLKSHLLCTGILMLLTGLLISLLPNVARAQAETRSQGETESQKQERLKVLDKYTPEELAKKLQEKTQTGLPPEVAWEVVPLKSVRDNYGHYVSSKYIAIDITVHNTNTSDQINVQAFTFGGTRVTDPYKNLDPNLVRGSIVKGQETGARNTTVRVIKVIGNLAAGAAGFVKNTGASATYGRGVTIFSDPFEKGVELIVPDTTVTYLTAWDKDEVFKKGFIVDAGKEVTGRIFLPISLVCELLQSHQPPVTAPCKEGGWLSSPRYDPVKIHDNLGQLKVLGNHITLRVNQPITETLQKK